MPARPERRLPVASLRGVGVHLGSVRALDDVWWTIRTGERWAVVGPNGAGKTSLLRVLSAWIRPDEGTATVLGETLGRTDMRRLRGRIGFAGQSVTDLLRPTVCALDVVLSAPHGALETWWHRYDDAAVRSAGERLADFGVGPDRRRRPLVSLSAGERQRVQLARAFAASDELVVLDEPTAGLDVGGREDLVARLAGATAATDAAIVLVTHHLEEIPPTFDRVLLVGGGRVRAAGPSASLLTGPVLTELFGLPLEVGRRRGRWWARSVAGALDEVQQTST